MSRSRLTRILTLTATFAFLVTIKFSEKNHNSNNNNKYKNSVITTESGRKSGRVVFTPGKFVTKSLDRLGKMDEINRYFLFFNQAPNQGGEILVLLLQKLQGMNNFKHVRFKRLQKDTDEVFSNIQQEKTVDEMYEIMKKAAVPLSFDSSIYFLNFTSYDKQMPTYINFVRNPLERQTKKIKPMSIPYFCGYDPRCNLINSEWALRRAKENIEKYYPVVGVLEELNATLEVMEHSVPYFFRGVQSLYQKELLYFHNSNKKFSPMKSVQKLKKFLIKEMELYDWLRSRLFNRLRMLRNH